MMRKNNVSLGLNFLHDTHLLPDYVDNPGEFDWDEYRIQKLSVGLDLVIHTSKDKLPEENNKKETASSQNGSDNN